MHGQPFLYVNKEVDPGLIATIKNDVVPWLQQLAPKTAEQEQQLAEDPRAHWFTLVFNREGYSPELFAELFKSESRSSPITSSPNRIGLSNNSVRILSNWPADRR